MCRPSRPPWIPHNTDLVDLPPSGKIPGPGFPYTQTNDTTRTGWAIGGGIETMLPGRWLLRGEYRYADFGTWNTAFGGSPIIVKEFDIVTHTGYFGVAKKF
jgi:outer membrane immunogenic protein